MKENKRFRLRIIIPAFPNFNIYSMIAATTTSVGPVYVGTAASKLELWDVEIIDENNCHGKFYPKDKNNKLDHGKLQQERPADVVGFYGSISSTIPRLFSLAGFYKSQGVKTTAGGKHIENRPLEALQNSIDVVVFNEGEETIKELLLAWQYDQSLKGVKGISYLENNSMVITEERPLISNFETEIYPDFNLLYYAKMKIYPINRTRGCNSNCEFCAVKDRARSCTPQKMYNNVVHLVETMGAKHFFETSDHFAANRYEAIEFCKMISAYQKSRHIKLAFTVQTRITDARYPELLKAMKEANVEVVCIGYESPIDSELKNMQKGYRSEDLILWTKIFHKYQFNIHSMFIFGYPQKASLKDELPLKEKVKIFRRFIRKARLETIQVLLPIPLPGTDLYERLERGGRLFPLDKIGWEYYDGQYPLFLPDDGNSPEDLLKAAKDIMFPFYSFFILFKIIMSLVVLFPGFMFISSLTFLTGKTKYFIKAFQIWRKKIFNKNILKFSGFIIVYNWVKKYKMGIFQKKLQKAISCDQKSMV